MADVNVTIGADTGGFATGMASIQSTVGRVTSSVTSSLASLVNPASLVTAALTSGVFAIINYADRIYDTAQRFRVGTTELQQFGQAAEKNGASLESVAKAFNKLDVALSQARSGNKEMQKSLEALNIKDWADRSVSLSDNMLKIGTSSMEASDMVKVLGKSGTELRETLAALASGNEKLAAAIDEKTVKALSDMSDSLKELKNQSMVAGATSVGWLRTFDDWILKVRGHLVDLTNSTRDFIGLGPIFAAGVAGAGQVVGGVRNPAPPPGTPDADDLARTERFFELQEQIEVTLTKEKAVWDATHSAMEKITELQNHRVTLEELLAEAVAQEGEDSQRVWELRGEIAAIISQTIPLQQQISKEEEKQTIELARQAEAEAQGIQRANIAIEQSQDRLRIEDLRRRGLTDEARLLEIQIDFNNRIKDAIDAANRARGEGLEQTAEQNELLAQQLEIEKENSLQKERQNQALEQQRKRLENIRQVETQIRDAVAAILYYNLRLGETSQIPSFFNDPSTGFTGELTGEALRIFNMIRDLTTGLSRPGITQGEIQSTTNQILALQKLFLDQIKLLESINKNLTPQPGWTG